MPLNFRVADLWCANLEEAGRREKPILGVRRIIASSALLAVLHRARDALTTCTGSDQFPPSRARTSEANKLPSNNDRQWSGVQVTQMTSRSL